MIGRQSGVPLTQAVQLLTARTPAMAGTTPAAMTMLPARLLGSVASAPPSRTRAGQPPPMMQPPFAACLRLSFPAAE
jgi:hypothetical protein